MCIRDRLHLAVAHRHRRDERVVVVYGVDAGVGDDEISGGGGETRVALGADRVRKAECRGGSQQAGGSRGQDFSFSLPGMRVQMRMVPQIDVPLNRLYCCLLYTSDA